MSDPRLLVVIRHAKASWKTHEPDLRRPITRRGTRDAVVAGQALARVPFDLVLVSPATRTQQTWQTLELAGVRAAEVRTVEELYDGVTPDVVAALRGLSDDQRRVALIGHEPTVSELVLDLAQPSPATATVEEKFPTMGIAMMGLDGSWADLAEGGAQLVSFEVPRG